MKLDKYLLLAAIVGLVAVIAWHFTGWVVLPLMGGYLMGLLTSESAHHGDKK